MKREEKNARSRQRILEAALQEFSAKGYTVASLTTVCGEFGISKGIIYHYFKDKDELYLACVKKCFDEITAYLKQEAFLSGTPEKQVQAYFDGRLRFFANNPIYLELFADAAYNPPPALVPAINDCRREFDELNVSVLTELLSGCPIRTGLDIPVIVEEFRIYMDFFNMRFMHTLSKKIPAAQALKEHEERCHLQLDILLHGVLGEQNEI